MSRISLDQVRVASPCHVRWDAMTGDARSRFCHDCKQRVYNVADMTRDEAKIFLGENVGIACIRLHRRADGTILTRDCPVGRRAARVRELNAFALAALLFALTFLWIVGISVRSGSRQVRDVEPFRTLFSWMSSPQPAPQTVGTGISAIVSGGGAAP